MNRPSLFLNSRDVSWLPYIPKSHTAYTWNVPNSSHSSTPPHSQFHASVAHGSRGVPSPKTKEPVSDFARLDVRVGRVVSCQPHPNSDKLYLEKIDAGEEEPRQIISGLAGFVPIEKLENAFVLVVLNLKAAKLRGLTSHGMILCASNDDKSKIEVITPPPDSAPGDRVFVQGETVQEGQQDKVISIAKKNNAWGLVKDKLMTDSEMCACFGGKPLVTSKGACKTASLTNAMIS